MSTDFEFVVTDTPPEPTKRVGRKGDNPFRRALEESYEKGFADTDEWYEFTVDVSEQKEDEDKRKEMRKAADRIRAAGQIHPKIGTQVRADYENLSGRIAFRGVEWVARDRGKSEDAGRDAVSDDAYDDDGE